MKLRITGALAAMAFVATAATPALAVSGSITGGSVLGSGSAIVLAPATTPAAVGEDNFDTDNLYVLPEKQNVTLLSDLDIDVGDTILAGTTVNSFLVLFDPLIDETLVGTISFDSLVLGINRKGASIIATTPLFGLPSLTYLTPTGFALDAGIDFVTINKPDDNSVRIGRMMAGTPGDMFRVFTLVSLPPTVGPAVPEPATWAMMLGGFALAGWGLRRQAAARPSAEKAAA